MAQGDKAGEWASFLQYYHLYTMASGMNSPAIAAVWKEHSEEEREHAGRINARISQIGGVPANSPEKTARLGPLPFKEGHGMASQLRDDLVFERATISLYDEITRTCAFNDSTTRRLFESLLADENEHAEALSSFLFELDASTGQQIESAEKTEMKRRAA